MTPNVGDTLIDSINNSFYAAASFIPNFIAGIVLLLIGIILGSFAKKLVLEIAERLKLEATLKKYGVPETSKDFSWVNILSEIVRWFVIIMFLIPTADVWGLQQIVTVLNAFLLYLPNVFVAAIIAVVGFAVARLTHDVVLASTREMLKEGAPFVANIARWAIIIFVMLAVLNQLGVARDLIRILFTGFVAMIALAGGIAFGLGGQDTARAILENVRKRLKA
jgi:hypothetical protein